jgi:hypothetical protein
MMDVHSAIWLSSMPSPLNMSTHTMFRITNGRPIAKYAEGTHLKGDFRVIFSCINGFVISNRKNLRPKGPGDLKPNEYNTNIWSLFFFSK